jgi:hypothetical protein
VAEFKMSHDQKKKEVLSESVKTSAEEKKNYSSASKEESKGIFRWDLNILPTPISLLKIKLSISFQQSVSTCPKGQKSKIFIIFKPARIPSHMQDTFYTN